MEKANNAIKKLLLQANFAKVELSAERECPICGYHGRFKPYGFYYVRPDAVCGGCGSFERHRQLYLYVKNHLDFSNNPSILHFAPERSVSAFLRPMTKDYQTADLFSKNVDHNWNIEKIDCPDDRFDVIICSHVLEHVDAEVALRECRRILRPGGVALLMVPICEGLDTTYVDDTIQTDRERWIHFQQPDHVRVFGKDFRDLIRNAGFTLTESVAQGAEAVRYGLMMGERIFIARK